MFTSSAGGRSRLALLVLSALAPVLLTVPASAGAPVHRAAARVSAKKIAQPSTRDRHHRVDGLPSERRWLHDVAAALSDVPAYLNARARQGDRLAVVIGVDNVALAAHYDWPKGVGPTLRVARRARKLGMTVFFVTGRMHSDVRHVVGPLRKAGFVWDGICGRSRGVRIPVAKERCRRSIAERGYTITANISSNTAAFHGGYYERAVLLPDYGGRLG